jgi:AcrR family transcriptional regulator
MPASVTCERPGKRDRLIAGARETIYRQGFEATTIADIAEASDVPLGNVYYYFKSKDELLGAAIDSYAQESRERLSLLLVLPDVVPWIVCAPGPQARQLRVDCPTWSRDVLLALAGVPESP